MEEESVLENLVGARVIGCLFKPFDDEAEWAIVFDDGRALVVEGGLLTIAEPQQIHSAILRQRERLARDAITMESLAKNFSMNGNASHLEPAHLEIGGEA